MKAFDIHLASRSSSNESTGKGVYAAITYKGEDRILAFVPSAKALSDLLGELGYPDVDTSFGFDHLT
tara:strand:- start:4081 stop:4281 length:201 start_codon:yes stop_codon:yes gene_type:complete